MSATRLIPAHIVTDLKHAGARLRNSRVLKPRHDDTAAHTDCEICRWTARVNYLLDQIPTGETP